MATSPVTVILAAESQPSYGVLSDSLATALETLSAGLRREAPTQISHGANPIDKYIALSSALRQKYDAYKEHWNSDYTLDPADVIYAEAEPHELVKEGNTWRWVDENEYFHFVGVRIRPSASGAHELLEKPVYMTIAIGQSS